MNRTQATIDSGAKGSSEWQLSHAVLHDHVDSYVVKQPRVVHLRVRPSTSYHQQHFILKGAH